MTHFNVRGTIPLLGLLFGWIAMSESTPSIFFQVLAASTTAEEMLQQAALDLEAGDVQSALKKFAPSEKTRDTLTKLDERGRIKLAEFLKQARFTHRSGDYYAYEAPWVEEDGSITQIEIGILRLDSGEWVISNW